MTVGETFEATYPRYEFSDLVRVSLLVGTWIGRYRRARNARNVGPAGGVTAAA